MPLIDKTETGPQVEIQRPRRIYRSRKYKRRIALGWKMATIALSGLLLIAVIGLAWEILR